jgi:hypothetical protein
MKAGGRRLSSSELSIVHGEVHNIEISPFHETHADLKRASDLIEESSSSQQGIAT